MVLAPSMSRSTTTPELGLLIFSGHSTGTSDCHLPMSTSKIGPSYIAILLYFADDSNAPRATTLSPSNGYIIF